MRVSHRSNPRLNRRQISVRSTTLKRRPKVSFVAAAIRRLRLRSWSVVCLCVSVCVCVRRASGDSVTSVYVSRERFIPNRQIIPSSDISADICHVRIFFFPAMKDDCLFLRVACLSILSCPNSMGPVNTPDCDRCHVYRILKNYEMFSIMRLAFWSIVRRIMSCIRWALFGAYFNEFALDPIMQKCVALMISVHNSI